MFQKAKLLNVLHQVAEDINKMVIKLLNQPIDRAINLNNSIVHLVHRKLHQATLLGIQIEDINFSLLLYIDEKTK